MALFPEGCLRSNNRNLSEEIKNEAIVLLGEDLRVLDAAMEYNVSDDNSIYRFGAPRFISSEWVKTFKARTDKGIEIEIKITTPT